MMRKSGTFTWEGSTWPSFKYSFVMKVAHRFQATYSLFIISSASRWKSAQQRLIWCSYFWKRGLTSISSWSKTPPSPTSRIPLTKIGSFLRTLSSPWLSSYWLRCWTPLKKKVRPRWWVKFARLKTPWNRSSQAPYRQRNSKSGRPGANKRSSLTSNCYKDLYQRRRPA